MTARWLALLLAALLAGPAVAADEDAEDEETNPHRMSSPDDEEGCGYCHEEDMGLSASLLETCLSCHSTTEHSGSDQHLGADAASVARLQPTPVKADEAATLPLTEDGVIWCGTCHLYHDPQVNEEALLTEAWRPGTTGVAGAVGDAVVAEWGNLAGKHRQPLPVARLSSKGSAWLRLPVADGRLCTECHRQQGKPGQ